MIALAPREFHLFQAAGRDFLYLVPSAAIFGTRRIDVGGAARCSRARNGPRRR
jgi:hypothetical protein